MPRAILPTLRAPLLSLAAALLFVLSPPSSASGQIGGRGSGVTAAPGFAALQGFVIDSVHNTALAGATVQIEGTTRSTKTTAEGRYLIDSIPPGSHRVLISHAVLDTIGLSLVSPSLALRADQVHTIDLAIPSGSRIVSILCSAAELRIRGPGALIGFVRDPETGGPAVGSKVQLVFEESDPLGFKKTVRTREKVVDSTGYYRICGLPTPMTGKVQVFRNGVSSGEVPASIEEGVLGLRSVSIVSKHAVVATVVNDSGASKQVYRGSARLTGRVVNKVGQPLGNALVTVPGSGMTT